MALKCPKPSCSSLSPRISKHGRFFRKSDSRLIFRFLCLNCLKSFSYATLDPCFAQKKRRVNSSVFTLLVSGVSMRRIALILNIHRTTVERKLHFLAQKASIEHQVFTQSFKPYSLTSFQFDEMETFEHSKLKPLSIALAVDDLNRKILGFSVSQMPAKGLLAKKSIKKYGYRKDFRPLGLEKLFNSIAALAHKKVLIRSDQNPLYPIKVKKFFPHSTHFTEKSRKACVVGQGELKQGGFDPLFMLNHTAAMIRANVNRLFRRSWCTTKKPERLIQHLTLYMNYHNQVLTA